MWAGIDEAGYGPKLGPLVVACTAFGLRDVPSQGALWELLSDAVARQARGADGRLVINDSKKVYSGPYGLKRLEEGVLAFLGTASCLPGDASEVFSHLGCAAEETQETPPWSKGVGALKIPVATNASAVSSKTQALLAAMQARGVRMVLARAETVNPGQFNSMVRRTHNKSAVLFQRCGLLLQEVSNLTGSGEVSVVVDQQGGRRHYRPLLREVFPASSCDILCEDEEASVYRIGGGAKTLRATFRKNAEKCSLPVALASMAAKYIRELHMLCFNRYWQGRMEGLKPTAGYGKDAGRFLRDIAPLLEQDRVDLAKLVRSR